MQPPPYLTVSTEWFRKNTRSLMHHRFATVRVESRGL